MNICSIIRIFAKKEMIPETLSEDGSIAYRVILPKHLNSNGIFLRSCNGMAG